MKPTSFLLSLLVVAAFASSLIACKVPVFRYALERWASDNYRFVAIVDDTTSESATQAIARLRELDSLPVNAEFEVINLSTLTEAELWSVEGVEDTGDLPVLQVFYPEKSGNRTMCWTGDLSVANINHWIDSPLRTAVASDLASGVSATWVFAEGPDADENAAMLGKLNKALATATQRISVPVGVIRREDAARVIAEDPSASMDDILRSDIPLRIEFSIHRLLEDDPDETALLAMLSGGENLIQPPFVCPVFGRARIAEPLPAESLNESVVVKACEYLVGECSCSVKAASPGIDMLINMDWQAQLGNDIVMVNSVAPETPTVLPVPPGKSHAAPPEQPKDSQSRNWQWIAVGLFIIGACICIRKIMRANETNRAA